VRFPVVEATGDRLPEIERLAAAEQQYVASVAVGLL
jgi:hypothetical protein